MTWWRYSLLKQNMSWGFQSYMGKYVPIQVLFCVFQVVDTVTNKHRMYRITMYAPSVCWNSEGILTYLGFDEFPLDERTRLKNPDKWLDPSIGYRNILNIRMLSVQFHSTRNETLKLPVSKYWLQLITPKGYNSLLLSKHICTNLIVTLLTKLTSSSYSNWPFLDFPLVFQWSTPQTPFLPSL